MQIQDPLTNELIKSLRSSPRPHIEYLDCPLHSTVDCPRPLQFICVKPNCKYRFEPICQDCIVTKHRGNQNQKQSIAKVSEKVKFFIDKRVDKLTHSFSASFKLLKQILNKLSFTRQLWQQINLQAEETLRRLAGQCQCQVMRLQELKEFELRLDKPMPYEQMKEQMKRYQQLISTKNQESLISNLDIAGLDESLTATNSYLNQLQERLNKLDWHAKIPFEFELQLYQEKCKPVQKSAKTILINEEECAEEQGQILRIESNNKSGQGLLNNLDRQLLFWKSYEQISLRSDQPRPKQVGRLLLMLQQRVSLLICRRASLRIFDARFGNQKEGLTFAQLLEDIGYFFKIFSQSDQVSLTLGRTALSLKHAQTIVQTVQLLLGPKSARGRINFGGLGLAGQSEYIFRKWVLRRKSEVEVSIS